MKKRTLFKNHIGELIAAFVLGFLELLALSLYYRDSIVFWMKNAGTLFLFLGLGIALAAVFYVVLRLLEHLFRPEVIMGRSLTCSQTPPQDFSDRHPFLLSFIVLAVFYLPWIICFYPGSALYDMMYQTVQANGFMAVNAHHPIFATWVIGLCSRLGLLLSGKLNLGIFFYILLQTTVCILSFSYMLSFMAKKGVSKGFRLVCLAFLAVPPLWGGMMQCGTKDVLFTGLFVLFMVQSAKLLFEEGFTSGKRQGMSHAKDAENHTEEALKAERKHKTWYWISYGALVLLLCLYRNGIIVIMVPTLLVFFLPVRKNKAMIRGFLPAAVCAVVLAGLFGTITKQVYHTKTETGEILSIPFQQTARYVRDHEAEMTEEEQKVVETTFSLDDYRKLGKLYYPMSSDPVKARYYWWASPEEKEILAQYFSNWFKMLKKHPETYAEATLSNTYGYYSITPVIKNQKGGAGTTVQFFPDQLAVENVVDASDGTLSRELIPESPESLRGVQRILEGWYRIWLTTPVIDLFTKCGFYFILLLAATLFYSKQKNRLVLLTIPAWLLILMAVASPVNEHIRYILPVAAALPLCISMAAAREKRPEVTDV